MHLSFLDDESRALPPEREMQVTPKPGESKERINRQARRREKARTRTSTKMQEEEKEKKFIPVSQELARTYSSVECKKF